jgi:hypothetical protein
VLDGCKSFGYNYQIVVRVLTIHNFHKGNLGYLSLNHGDSNYMWEDWTLQTVHYSTIALSTKTNKLVQYKTTFKSQITIKEQQIRLNKKWYPFGSLTSLTQKTRIPTNKKCSGLKLIYPTSRALNLNSHTIMRMFYTPFLVCKSI